MTDKIEKLITSSCEEDVVIGCTLLSKYSTEEIIHWYHSKAQLKSLTYCLFDKFWRFANIFDDTYKNFQVRLNPELTLIRSVDCVYLFEGFYKFMPVKYTV